MRRRLSEAARARRAIRAFDKSYGAGGRGERGSLLLESRGRREEALKARAAEAARRCEATRSEARRREIMKRYVAALRREGYGAEEAVGAIKDASRGLVAKRREEAEARREDEAKRPFGREPRATSPDWGDKEGYEDEGVRSLGDDDDDDADADDEDDADDEEGY